MKIEKYIKLKDNRYNVKIDGRYFKLYDDVIVKFELLRKKEIDETLFQNIVSYNAKLEGYYKGLKYISIKLRTEEEMARYLSKEYDKSVVEEIIEKLKNEGYLNEDIYVQSYLADKINLGKIGPNKIKKEMVNLGLDEMKVNNAIEAINDEVWMEKIAKIVKKKMASNKTYGNNKLKEKLVYELGNAGYYKWMIEEVIDKIDFGNNDNLLKKELDKVSKKLEGKYSGYELENKLIQRLVSKGFNYSEIKNMISNKNT